MFVYIAAGAMRQKTIIDEVDDFDFNSDVDTDFEDSFPLEISNEVTFTPILPFAKVIVIVSIGTLDLSFIFIAQVLLNKKGSLLMT